MSSTSMQRKDDKEAFLEFMTKECENATEPLNLIHKVREFVGITGSKTNVTLLRSFIRTYGTKVRNIPDEQKRARQLFCLGVPVDEELLKELEKHARVTLDGNGKIVKYESHDKSLTLQGDHSCHVKMRIVLAEKRKSQMAMMEPPKMPRSTEKISGRVMDKEATEPSRHKVSEPGPSTPQDPTPSNSSSVSKQRAPEYVPGQRHPNVPCSASQVKRSGVFYFSKTMRVVRKPEERNQENEKLIKFFCEQCETAEKPLNLQKLAAEFKEKEGSNTWRRTLVNVVGDYKNKEVFEIEDRKTRVRQLFGLGVRINDTILAELREHATVELDNFGCITKYAAFDGSLILSGDHCPRKKQKETMAEQRRSQMAADEAENEEEEEEDDGDLELQPSAPKKPRVKDPGSSSAPQREPTASSSTPKRKTLIPANQVSDRIQEEDIIVLDDADEEEENGQPNIANIEVKVEEPELQKDIEQEPVEPGNLPGPGIENVKEEVPEQVSEQPEATEALAPQMNVVKTEEPESSVATPRQSRRAAPTPNPPTTLPAAPESSPATQSPAAISTFKPQKPPSNPPAAPRSFHSQNLSAGMTAPSLINVVTTGETVTSNLAAPDINEAEIPPSTPSTTPERHRDSVPGPSAPQDPTPSNSSSASKHRESSPENLPGQGHPNFSSSASQVRRYRICNSASKSAATRAPVSNPIIMEKVKTEIPEIMEDVKQQTALSVSAHKCFLKQIRSIILTMKLQINQDITSKIEETIEKLGKLQTLRQEMEEKVKIEDFRNIIISGVNIAKKSSSSSSSSEDTRSFREFVMLLTMSINYLRMKEMDELIGKLDGIMEEPENLEKRIPVCKIEKALDMILEILT